MADAALGDRRQRQAGAAQQAGDAAVVAEDLGLETAKAERAGALDQLTEHGLADAAALQLVDDGDRELAAVGFVVAADETADRCRT